MYCLARAMLKMWKMFSGVLQSAAAKGISNTEKIMVFECGIHFHFPFPTVIWKSFKAFLSFQSLSRQICASAAVLCWVNAYCSTGYILFYSISHIQRDVCMMWKWYPTVLASQLWVRVTVSIMSDPCSVERVCSQTYSRQTAMFGLR